MTTREFYQSVLSANISVEMSEKASELIAALDKRNASRKSSDSKEKREVLARRDTVYAVVRETNKAMTADEVAALAEITVGQARAALGALVKDGMLLKGEVKVDKSKRMMYCLPAEVTAE